MGEKVQLETGAEGVVGQGGHGPLHRRPGVGHQNIKATETAHAGVDRVLRGSGGGDVDGQPAVIAAQCGQCFGQGSGVAVHQKHRSRLCRKGPRCGQTNRPGPAGDQHDLATERRRCAAAQLGLFQRPIFAIEHVGGIDRGEPPNGLSVRHHPNCLLANIPSNPGGSDISPDADDPNPLGPDQTGGRRQLGLGPATAGVFMIEIIYIARRIIGDCLGNRGLSGGQRGAVQP